MANNQFDSCLAELSAAQSAEFGTYCHATIGGQHVECFIETALFNDAIPDVGGGVTQKGTQRIIVRKALLNAGTDWVDGQPPINTTETNVLGIDGYVLDVDEIQGILYITTGLPSGQ